MFDDRAVAEAVEVDEGFFGVLEVAEASLERGEVEHVLYCGKGTGVFCSCVCVSFCAPLAHCESASVGFIEIRGLG